MRDSAPTILFAALILGTFFLISQLPSTDPTTPPQVIPAAPTPESFTFVLNTQLTIDPATDQASPFYEPLKNDDAAPNVWLNAAQQFTGSSMFFRRPIFSRRGILAGTLAFDLFLISPTTKLRLLKNPSISELLHKRLHQIAASPESKTYLPPFAQTLGSWDGPAAIPDLRQITPNIPPENLLNHLHLRASLGDPLAFSEYATYLKQQDPSPSLTPTETFPDYRLLLEFPTQPDMLNLASFLFTRPDSPLAPCISGNFARLDAITRAIHSEFIGLPAFQQQLLIGLSKTNPCTISVGNAPRPMRLCDALAIHLSHVTGFPPFDPDSPLAERNAAVAQCRDILTRYGPRFRYPPGNPDYPNHSASRFMIFPKLDHPATPQDVASGLALFTLAGQGTARPLNITFPARARWTETDPANPDILTPHDGFLWQAESLTNNNKTTYLYGILFTGGIATLPGDKLEILPFEENNDGSPPFSPLSNNLDISLRPPGNIITLGRSWGAWTFFIPNPQPTLTISLRNRSGIPFIFPTLKTADIQPDPAHTPLAPGITITLETQQIIKSAAPPGGASNQWVTLTPRTSTTAPATSTSQSTTRPASIPPAQTIEYATFDLSTLYDLQPKTTYRLTLTFYQPTLGFTGNPPPTLFSIPAPPPTTTP